MKFEKLQKEIEKLIGGSKLTKWQKNHLSYKLDEIIRELKQRDELDKEEV